jgi:hypothetical protein
VNGELKAVRILIDQPANFDKIVLLEDVNRVGDVVPHLGVDLPGAVAQRKRQVDVAALLGFNLLARYQE